MEQQTEVTTGSPAQCRTEQGRREGAHITKVTPTNKQTNGDRSVYSAMTLSPKRDKGLTGVTVAGNE